MSTAAILPVKDFSFAKSRLSETFAANHRRALAEAMYSDVIRAIRHSQLIDRVIVVTNNLNAAAIADDDNVTVIDDHGSSHSESAAQGLAFAMAQGIERALFIAGDCPLVTSAELDELLTHPTGGPQSALIIPDRHGTGTNGLLLTPPDSLTPSFGEGSCERHIRLAHEQGTAPEVVAVRGLGLDVDTPDDLAALRAALSEVRGGAAHTRGLLAQLDRSIG